MLQLPCIPCNKVLTASSLLAPARAQHLHVLLESQLQQLNSNVHKFGQTVPESWQSEHILAALQEITDKRHSTDSQIKALTSQVSDCNSKGGTIAPDLMR